MPCAELLPLSHIFERAGVFYYMYSSAGVYFSSVECLSAALSDIKPHTFSAVPRVLEKVHDKLVGKAREFSGFKRRLYLWAVERAERFDPNARRSPLKPPSTLWPTSWSTANGAPRWAANSNGSM